MNQISSSNFVQTVGLFLNKQTPKCDKNVHYWQENDPNAAKIGRIIKITIGLNQLSMRDQWMNAALRENLTRFTTTTTTKYQIVNKTLFNILMNG